MDLFNGRIRIDIDDKNVTLKEKTDRKVTKKVDDVVVETDDYEYKNLGYYTTLESAIKGLFDYLMRQKGKDMQSQILETKEILNLIIECKNELLDSITSKDNA